ncbi:TniQ family protein [Streptomyces sp. ISL-44]|uniref:TniQ family protein n=1 Tax=Streptomyces sp. ISL-44 TaxID=2819184 RepID=UPI001BE6AF11|nr:TniQ family protein [Streptomyces sp. ISL-44]MBT2546114.1 TniQ family protein [Streptomyces sp. ISL-44]
MITPLPRSLDPLPGELLAGYVMRLAHRLDVAPDTVLRRTGLAEYQPNTQAVTRTALSLELPARRMNDFQTATRLTGDEATALTLLPLAPRYPPIAHSLDVVRAGKRIPALDWLFPAAARYCPDCLAGDGTPSQTEHGGPWKTDWRLPVVFACPRHQRFLEHLCPECQRPIADRVGQLIPRPTIAGLHPAQCRAPLAHGSRRAQRAAQLCGARLDQQPPGPAAPLPPELAALQQKITTMLSPDTPATTASEYFSDLQMTSGLVMITWPRARPTASGIDTHHTDLVLAARQDLSHSINVSTPPPHAPACSSILLAADTILSATDLRTALAPLAPVENRTRSGIAPKRHRSWDAAFRRYQDDCSQRFQSAAEYLVSTHRRSGRGGSRLPQLGLDYGPQHVPAFLPLEWAERHLGAFTVAFSMPVLRRTTSAFLVRRALGKTVVDAAEFLGLGIDGKGMGTPITRWARRQGTPEAFERAVDAIAAELASSPLIDYQHRRTLLADWALPPDAWRHIDDQLKRQPTPRYVSEDRARLAATAYIWTQVTYGETQFAPQPAEARNDPALDAAWSQDRFTIGHWLRQNKVPFYQQMKPLLDAYADQLTRAVDATCSGRQLKRSLAK